MSQEELAEKIGVIRQTISNWKLNETAPNITEAKELSKIFNISLDELVDNDKVGTENYNNVENLLKAIEEYFQENGGICTYE